MKRLYRLIHQHTAIELFRYLLTSGSSKIGIMMRKLQTTKKVMGRTMFTLIGRSRSGCFHLWPHVRLTVVAALPEVEETADGKCDEEGFNKGGEVDENVDI